MKGYSLKMGGVEIVLHKELLKRRNENTRFSHYEGSPETLLFLVLHAWCDGKYTLSPRVSGADCYIVKVHHAKFFCKQGAVKLTDRLDYDSARY